jgi:hypothetical protein
MLVKTISAGERLMEAALQARMCRMRAEIADENPTLLEVSCSRSAWWPGGCSWRCSRASSRRNTGVT